MYQNVTNTQCRRRAQLSPPGPHEALPTDSYNAHASLAWRGLQACGAGRHQAAPVRVRIRNRNIPQAGAGPSGLEEFGLAAQPAVHMPLGVREYFPDTFRTAYRQKARWTLGIGLQGWSQVGWEGSLATKYLLFRDLGRVQRQFATSTDINPRHESRPFWLAATLFLLAFFGLVVGLFPYLLPQQLSFYAAAAPDSSLRFMLPGILIFLPLILAYTLWGYHIFRGKIEDYEEGY